MLLVLSYVFQNFFKNAKIFVNIIIQKILHIAVGVPVTQMVTKVSTATLSTVDNIYIVHHKFSQICKLLYFCSTVYVKSFKEKSVVIT